MRQVRFFLLLYALMMFCNATSAMSLREFHGLEKIKHQGMNYANYYLVGVMEGAIEADAHAVREGSSPRVCLNGRHLEPGAARQLFDAEIRRNKDLYEADMPVQLVMFNALASIYSCSP